MYHIRDLSLVESPTDSRDYIAESIYTENYHIPKTYDLRKNCHQYAIREVRGLVQHNLHLV